MAVLTLQPDETSSIDTFLSQQGPTNNYGIYTSLYVGVTGTNFTYKSILQFDLSSIPATAVISSAILTLWCSSQESAVDRTVTVRRGLVAFFEGVKNGTPPDVSQDGSTWNLRNANGSLAWGASGGLAGTDYVVVGSATDTVNITETSLAFDFNVATDVQAFVDGTYTNYGWWFIIGTGALSSLKVFDSSGVATTSQRPKLIVTYTDPATDMAGSSTGNSTVTGALHADAMLSGSITGTSTVSGTLTANAISGSASGTSTVTADLQATATLEGSISGTSTTVGRLVGDGRLAGSISGVATVSGFGSFEGQLRGAASGVATVTATGAALSLHIIRAQGCYDDPLLYITDGSVNANGQLNRLDLINPHIGFILNNWRPTIAQYKEGGTFSESPHGTGRRLTKRVFGNAIEVFDLKARGHNQNGLIEYTHELLSWQESAADFWTSEWADTPIYLVAKAARELNPRYAIIHVMSIPELENPYAQPFYAREKAAHEQITLRLERGDWTSNPPGAYECVAISSVRSWTVAGWSTGS